MYRLSNVLEKPLGRFGAPETDPGPAGMLEVEAGAAVSWPVRRPAALAAAAAARTSRRVGVGNVGMALLPSCAPPGRECALPITTERPGPKQSDEGVGNLKVPCALHLGAIGPARSI